MKTLLCTLLVAGFAIGCTSTAKENQLKAQAKITEAEAQKIALTKVPGGTIKEGELEEENGKLIWSFDIALPGTKDIAEVHVNAKTGDIVAVEKETIADEEKEAKEEAKERKAEI